MTIFGGGDRWLFAMGKHTEGENALHGWLTWQGVVCIRKYPGRVDGVSVWFGSTLEIPHLTFLLIHSLNLMLG